MNDFFMCPVRVETAVVYGLSPAPVPSTVTEAGRWIGKDTAKLKPIFTARKKMLVKAFLEAEIAE